MQNNVWKINPLEKKKKEEKNDDEYKSDTRLKNLWKSLEENKKKERHRKFHNWLKTEYEYNENYIPVEDILIQLCNDVFNIINVNGYVISDEKQLRNEIATFVYKESYA